MKRDALVGRTRELDALLDLEARGVRLVTLTGTGGVGKTRLARHLVEANEGAWFVDLTEARSDDDVIGAVARAIGLPLASGEGTAGATELVGRLLAAKGRALVVLDNAEQVVGAAAPLLAAWLDATTEVRFLVTSRERLRVRGEITLEVPPLEVSAGGDGVELFLVRAESTGRMLERTPEVLGMVGDIVRGLDGIPLAIELAAARTGILGLEQILARFQRRLDALAEGPRDAPARHATMRNAITWSWDLLDDDERAALAQCAVFRGGFTAEAAEVVLELGRDPLEVISALRDKSLLRTEAAREVPGKLRLGMFETIRELAAENLSRSGAADRAARRHAAHFIGTARAWGEDVPGPEGSAILKRLAAEEGNLLAIVERALENAHDADWVASGLGALLALEPLQRSRPTGPFVAQLDAVLRQADAHGPRVEGLVAQALVARAQAHRVLGRREPCVADLARAEQLADASGDRATWALAVGTSAEVSLLNDRDPSAVERFQRAIEVAREAGATRLATRFAANLDYFECLSLPRAIAIPRVHAALVSLDAVHDEDGGAILRTRFATMLLDAGHVDEARVQMSTALVTHRSRGDAHLEAWALYMLGMLEHEGERHEGAEAHFLAALKLNQDSGRQRNEAIVRLRLSLLRRDQERPAEAEAEGRRALEFFRRSGHGKSTGLSLSTLGGIVAAQDRIAEAEVLFIEARTALGEEAGDSFDGILAIERGHLDLARAREALRRGAPEAASPHLAAARARIEAAREAPRRSPALDSHDARCAVRRLEQTLARVEPPRDTLVIAEDATWFRPPEGAKVDLSSRPTLARVLLALAERRDTEPGEVVDVSELVARGWPDEAINPVAALNRIQVAVTTLRKLGVGAALLRKDGGWLLDPAVPFARARQLPS